MTSIAILGAGQLGAYLSQAAKNLNINARVLANRTDEMAVAIADQVAYENQDPVEAVAKLCDGADVVTFEKEDIPVAVLDSLEKMEVAGQLTVAPSPGIMRLIQNKALQKAWLTNKGFPTAPFLELPDPPIDARPFDELGIPFVLKTQRGGYDGLGVKVIHESDQLGDYARVPCIAEKLITGKREFSVIVARSTSGEIMSYPLFEMVFNEHGNVLEHVIAPAKLDESREHEARILGQEVVSALEGIGVFAVELFLDESGFMVNEISPRVHNTGHMTMEACQTSQFEQHVRAITGMALGPAAPFKPAAMINILYEPVLHDACEAGIGIEYDPMGIAVHWYGKREYRPLRKMGHITAVGASVDSALTAAENRWQSLSSR